MSSDADAPAQQNPDIIAACTRALESLRAQNLAFRAGAIATDDGFEVAQVPLSSAVDQRLASMASSLQALTEAVSRDRGLGSTEYSLVEAEQGRVLLRRVPNHSLMLLAVFSDEEPAGKAISFSRAVVNDLQRDLSSLPLRNSSILQLARMEPVNGKHQ